MRKINEEFSSNYTDQFTSCDSKVIKFDQNNQHFVVLHASSRGAKNDINKVLENIKTEGHSTKFVILGDFNLNFLDHKNREFLADALAENNLSLESVKSSNITNKQRLGSELQPQDCKAYLRDLAIKDLALVVQTNNYRGKTELREANVEVFEQYFCKADKDFFTYGIEGTRFDHGAVNYYDEDTCYRVRNKISPSKLDPTVVYDSYDLNRENIRVAAMKFTRFKYEKLIDCLNLNDNFQNLIKESDFLKSFFGSAIDNYEYSNISSAQLNELASFYSKVNDECLGGDISSVENKQYNTYLKTVYKSEYAKELNKFRKDEYKVDLDNAAKDLQKNLSELLKSKSKVKLYKLINAPGQGVIAKSESFSNGYFDKRYALSGEAGSGFSDMYPGEPDRFEQEQAIQEVVEWARDILSHSCYPNKLYLFCPEGGKDFRSDSYYNQAIDTFVTNYQMLVEQCDVERIKLYLCGCASLNVTEKSFAENLTEINDLTEESLAENLKKVNAPSELSVSTNVAIAGGVIAAAGSAALILMSAGVLTSATVGLAALSILWPAAVAVATLGGAMLIGAMLTKGVQSGLFSSGRRDEHQLDTNYDEFDVNSSY